MRTVEFPSGTHRTTQGCVAAILRAMDRRGLRSWSGGNVSRELADYLRGCGEVYESAQVGYAMVWLEKRGYAKRVLHENGRRVLEFSLHEDVTPRLPRTGISVNGHGHAPDPGFTRSGQSPATGDWERYRDVTRRGQPDDPREPRLPLPPLPLTTPDSLYRLDELTAALTAWGHADREAYATWVDRVLDQLEVM